MRRDADVGRVKAALRDGTVCPNYSVARRPVLYIHSSGGDGWSLHGTTGSMPSQRSLVNELVRKCMFSVLGVSCQGFGTSGLPVGSSIGGTASTYRGEIEAAVTWHKANLGSTNVPIGVLAQSRGVINTLVYMLSHPGAVKWLIGINPAWDLEDLYNRDLFAFRDDIEAAWGVTYPTLLPTEARIQSRAAELISVPILFIQGTLDPHNTTKDVFVAASGATYIAPAGMSHDDTTSQYVVNNLLPTMIDFINTHEV